MIEHAVHLTRRDSRFPVRILDSILRSLENGDRQGIAIETRPRGVTIDGFHHEGARHEVRIGWHDRGVTATIYRCRRNERHVLTIADYTVTGEDPPREGFAGVHPLVTRWRDVLRNHDGATPESLARSTAPALAVLVAAFERFSPDWHDGMLAHVVAGPEINMVGAFGKAGDKLVSFSSEAYPAVGGISPPLAASISAIFTKVIHVVPDDCEFRLTHTPEADVDTLTIGIHPAVRVRVPSNPVERLRLLRSSPALAADHYLIAPKS